MPNGYCEKIVRVDLTRRIVRDQELDQRLVKNFLGGTGVAAKILFDEVPAGISAFDPANRLIFMTGVLTGSGAPADARYGVVFKSPQTGIMPGLGFGLCRRKRGGTPHRRRGLARIRKPTNRLGS
jgi:aldehyde:ferredoxin oxidoreductase